jgi:hypothetical protein
VSAAAALSTVAGYRVVRRLGAGTRSVVYLGHATDTGAHGQAAVAIRVYEARSGLPEQPVQSEQPEQSEHAVRSLEQTVAALSTLTEKHPGTLPALLDLATLPDGRVALILERAGGGSLSELLRVRQRIEPGEAVTILAPLVAGLAALHQSGFAHATFGQASVLFLESGQPVLCGLSGLHRLPPFGGGAAAPDAGPTAGRAGDPRRPAAQPHTRLDDVRDDYARLTGLLRSVFDHLDPGSAVARRAEPVAAWFEQATATLPFEPCLEQLERRLFQWAPACPVRLGPAAESQEPESQEHGGVPGRLELSGGAAPDRHPDDAHADLPGEPREEVRRGPAGRRRLHAAHLPAAMAALAAAALDGNPLAALGARIRQRAGERIRGKQKPIVAAACLAGAAVVLGLTLIPPSGSPEAGDGRQGDGRQGDVRQDQVGRSAGPRAPATAQPDGQVPATPGSGIRVAAADRAAITGDDPVTAGPALLRVRAQCLAAASLICLDAADQAGSVALATDGYTVRMTQQGTPASADVVWDLRTASLAERTGDSALVTLTPGPGDPERKPASLLVVKGEAGWRLREIFVQ